MPSLGLSLLLMAAGAILAWAVEYTVTGIDIQVVGVILMIVGGIGLVLSSCSGRVFRRSREPVART